MKLWGQSYVTAGNLASFFTYPPITLYLIISLLIAGIFIFLKMNTMICYCFHSPEEARPDIPDLLYWGLLKTRQLLHADKLMLPIITLMLYTLINIPLLTGVTIYMHFPSDFWHGSSDRLFIKGLILLSLFLIAFISFIACIAK
jgi:membrane-anchored glycerophosphoryl diester phosphodiesterase (GDPDase)